MYTYETDITFPVVDGVEHVSVSFRPDRQTKEFVIFTPINQIATTSRDGEQIRPVLNDKDYLSLAVASRRDLVGNEKRLRELGKDLDRRLQEDISLTDLQRQALGYVGEAINTILNIPGGRRVIPGLITSPQAAS